MKAEKLFEDIFAFVQLAHQYYFSNWVLLVSCVSRSAVRYTDYSGGTVQYGSSTTGTSGTEEDCGFAPVSAVANGVDAPMNSLGSICSTGKPRLGVQPAISFQQLHHSIVHSHYVAACRFWFQGAPPKLIG